MNRIEAFCHKILMMAGLDSGFDAWLDKYLKSEDPLSDIVLKLGCCGSDTNKILSVLHSFCAEQPIEEAAVCQRMRLFLKDAYYAKRSSKEEIASAMYFLARNVGDPEEYNVEIWGDMYALDHYYDLAKKGILSWEQFDRVFFPYLDNGTPVDSNKIWNENL